tara:strand:+ start:331 stop:519 length:189 start_codon:yes stop_codon:yes gene_type:complete
MNEERERSLFSVDVVVILFICVILYLMIKKKMMMMMNDDTRSGGHWSDILVQTYCLNYIQVN